MSETDTLLEKLDAVAPIQKFDAFPKVQRTYTAKTAGGGIWTILALLTCILLVANDFKEYFWGWPDHEFAVDTKVGSTMFVNVDMIVNMPCHCAYTRLWSHSQVHILNRTFMTSQSYPWTYAMLWVTGCISAMAFEGMVYVSP